MVFSVHNFQINAPMILRNNNRPMRHHDSPLDSCAYYLRQNSNSNRFPCSWRQNICPEEIDETYCGIRLAFWINASSYEEAPIEIVAMQRHVTQIHTSSPLRDLQQHKMISDPIRKHFVTAFDVFSKLLNICVNDRCFSHIYIADHIN